MNQRETPSATVPSASPPISYRLDEVCSSPTPVLGSACTKGMRLSDAQYSKIDDDTADATIRIDEAQRIVMFNQSACSVFGYSATEIIGSPLEVLIPERFRATHRAHVARFSAGEQTMRHMASRGTRIYGLRKNGQEFPTDAAISKSAVDGKILLTVSLRDISEQLHNEDEQRMLAETGEILMRAGSDYQRLLTDIADVIVRNVADWCAVDIVQADDVRRVLIVHSDPSKAALCKALERYAIDRQRPNLVSEAVDTQGPILISDTSPGYLDLLAQSEEHLQLLRAFEPGSFIVVPLIARGHSLGALSFGSSRPSRRYGSRDVREAEHLASRVALAVDNARLHEALERAIQARDEVLGIVAHDLRNPLNAIVLRAHTLGLPGGDPARYQSAADSICRSAAAMHRLIEDLLDVTRLEAGRRLSIVPAAVATNAVLTDAIERQQAADPGSSRELHLDLTGAPPIVFADRARVLQILDNLLGNAMKFSRRHITLGAGTQGDEALFWVADDGTGISPEHLPRLFDRFWKGSETERKGVGLGLSIVQGIIRAHGGRIWVESEGDVGTTFYFTLPTAPDSTSESPTATP